jgi:hypothetical protein
MALMARRVKYGSHDYYMLGFQNFVNDTIGKSLWIPPPNIFCRMPTAIEEGIFSKRIPYLDCFFDKFSAKPGLASLVPRSRAGHIHFDFRPKFDPPTHLPRRERTRLFISSSVTADPGLRRWAARRSSTSASSSAAIGGSSSSKARRTSNCRWSKVSAGNSSRTSLKLIDPL